MQHALLYLAATKAGDKKVAGEQWSLLLAKLGKEHGALRQLGEVLAGKQPPKTDRLRRMAILPEQKRVLLVVVARRFPEMAKELLPLARQLDFEPDAVSLCLRKLRDAS